MSGGEVQAAEHRRTVCTACAERGRRIRILIARHVTVVPAGDVPGPSAGITQWRLREKTAAQTTLRRRPYVGQMNKSGTGERGRQLFAADPFDSNSICTSTSDQSAI